MSSETTLSVNDLLQELKDELERFDDREFERLVAHLFSRAIGDVSMALAKVGSQRGADTGTAGNAGRHLRVECKRYKETSSLSARDLGGEVLEAVLNDDLLEAWLLASTKSVSEQEQTIALQGGQKLGVPVVVIDWTVPAEGVGLSRLASLFAGWPDVVESWMGKKAADIARALSPHLGQSLERLRCELQPWQLGYTSLRNVTHEHIQAVWASRAASKSTLNQDAAGGRPDVTLVERAGPLEALGAWWSEPASVQRPGIISGVEGVGKTWAALDWLIKHVAELPATILLSATAVGSIGQHSETSVKELIVRALREKSRSTRSEEYWRARVEALLSRPEEDGAAVLLVIDGLNQQPLADWNSLARVLQSPALAGRVRLLCTTRQHYLDTDLKGFRNLEHRPVLVSVGTYNDVEFQYLLKANRLQLADFSPALENLARMPRLFALVLRLRDSISLQADASVPRLLFEYGRDAMQLRQGSTLTEDEWVDWLTSRAKEMWQGLKDAPNRKLRVTQEYVRSTLGGGHLGTEDVRKRLSDVVDGGFYRPVSSLTVKKFELNPDHASLGLGLALLDILADMADSDFGGVRAELEKWLEPVAAIDQVADVLRAALAVVAAGCVSDSSYEEEADGSVPTDALLTSWMQLQNPSNTFEADVAHFGSVFPLSMLRVVEQSFSQSHSVAQQYATQSLRRVPSTRMVVWQAIRSRMLDWFGQLDVTGPWGSRAHREHEEQRVLRVCSDVGPVDQGPILVLGERLVPTSEYLQGVGTCAAGVMEGHDLAFFMPVFRRAAIRETVQHAINQDGWRALATLIAFAGSGNHDMEAALVQMADEILAAPLEPHVNESVRRRVVARLLRATRDPQAEERANALVPENFDSWRAREAEYRVNPLRAHVNLRFGQVQAVLDAMEEPAESRLRRIESFVAHPALALPCDMLDAIVASLAAQPVNELNARMRANAASVSFDQISTLAARFAPESLARLARQLLADCSGRGDEKKFWSALGAAELLLPAGDEEAAGLRALRTNARAGDKERISNSWLLQVEIARLPLDAQLERLRESGEISRTDRLMSVVREASVKELLDFLGKHGSTSVDAVGVVLNVMAYQATPDADELAKLLVPFLEGEEKALRALAFVALGTCAPLVCGQALMALGWSGANEEAFCAHYGSFALAAATVHLPFEDVMPLLAAWRWLDAAVLRGSTDEELRAASEALVGIVMSAKRGDIVVDGNQTVYIPAPLHIARYGVSEPEDRPGDMEAFVARMNESAEDVNQRWERLASQTEDAIEEARKSGQWLFMHFVLADGVRAAFEVDPDVWRCLLEGLETNSSEFLIRMRSAEGLYLALCEVLLEIDAPQGRDLWFSLAEHLSRGYEGAAGLSELLHIAFRSPSTTAAEAVRRELLSLDRCNTNLQLFDLALAARLNGQSAWLEGIIRDDEVSHERWRQRRAIALRGFSEEREVDDLDWPSSSAITQFEELTQVMMEWRNRGALAKYWWQRYVEAPDADQAYGAWTVLLSCVDRRVHLWIRQGIPNGSRSDELQRLKHIHLATNSDELSKACKKKERKSKSLAEHFLGDESPRQWLTLDGQRF